MDLKKFDVLFKSGILPQKDILVLLLIYVLLLVKSIAGRRYLVIHLGGERHCESKVSCFRPQGTVQFRPELQPGPTEPLDSETSVLTVRLSRLPRRLPLRLDKYVNK